MIKLLRKYSIADLASVVGFCVGCAFVTYIIRMFGYFNVIGPELLGLYLDSDLVQGAIFALPAVIIVLSLIQTIYVSIFPLMERISPSVERGIARLPNAVKVEPTTFFGILAWIALISSVIITIVIPDDDKGMLLLFNIVTLMTCGVFAADYFVAYRKLSIFWIATLALQSYWCIYQTGRYEAQSDLRYSKHRYAVFAADKSFVNVVLLRSTSKAILMKVGSDIVMYDRSQVIRIERMPRVK